MRYDNTVIVQLTYKMNSKDLSKIVKYAPGSLKKAIFNSLIPEAQFSLKKEIKELKPSKKESLVFLRDFEKKMKEFTSIRSN